MRLSREQLGHLDRDVLETIAAHDGHATYVYRNWLRSVDRWKQRALGTADVLRACRRLLAQGLVEEDFRLPYAVMKSWRVTEKGRAALTESIDG